MTKKQKNFEITFPLTHKVVRDLKIVTEKVGDLIVSGTAYCDNSVLKTEVDDRYSIDIDFVKWTGTDIKPVLEVTGSMDEIEEYCIQKVASHFDDKPSSLFEEVAGIVRTHAKVFYGIDLNGGKK